MSGQTFLYGGPKGSGKSAILSRICQRQLALGDECWSNKDFVMKDPRVHYFSSIVEIPDLHHCSVFIDEAQREFDSREWEKLPASFRNALSESRHAQVDIYAATQDPNFLDTRFRRSVDHYYEIKRIAGSSIQRKGLVDVYPKFAWQISKMREYDIRRSDNITRPDNFFDLFAGWKFFTKKEFNFYDTLIRFNKVKKPSGDFECEKVDCWTCNTCGTKKWKDPEKSTF